MKQSLQLRLGQHLTMTPQLQQAIRLLQLSALELQAEVQEALETNPLLEMTEEGAQDERADSKSGVQDHDGDNGASSDQPDQSDKDINLQDSQSIPEDLPVDSAWDDVYDYAPTAMAAPAVSDRDFEQSDSATPSLQEHLKWQMMLTPFSDTDAAIAEAIIDSLGEDGYLQTSLEDLQQSVIDEFEDVELDEIEAVLRRVQHFDPLGVAGRDLRETLLIQFRQYDKNVEWYAEARLLLEEHIQLLGSRDYAQLTRRMKLSREDLQKVVALIQQLNPRPGATISDSHSEYIVPDVMVKKDKGKWKVELNTDSLPKVSINQHYARMAQNGGRGEDTTYLKNQMKEARWFIKSLQSRHETLLKVASCIVEHQRGFLEYGEEAMKPLVLHDIAEAVEMHESTISRVTTRKYMRTPRGVFELKYFFSSHVSTASGGECSATAIRALIKKLVADENVTKPLSDSKIASLLEDQGINVARRTIAKYREAMMIPPSNERKRLT
ncbi:MAG: RNA polymerase factor sigma-54 [Gammaproteobacteria bacterium]|nr:MAG: RNA polymerase factor sigma-54 [Gammaproteobacteria bacterium]